MNNNNFSARLKEARTAAALTQKRMSDLMIIPKRSIEDWEAGTRTPPEYVQRFVLAELRRIAEAHSRPTAIKYAVMIASFEFNPSVDADVKSAFWSNDGSSDAKLVKLCDSLEEAQEVIADVTVTTERFNHKLARATVAYIEMGEYSVDGTDEWEFIQGSDYYDFKAE